MRELVLGYCDYTWDKSYPFVKSLRESGYKGDVVFLRGTNDPYTIQKYEEFGVCTYATDCLFDYDDAVEFLTSHADRYDNVLATDVRDVIFQANPFMVLYNSDLHLFEEDLNIGEQNLNAHWMRAGYGQEILNSFGNDKIINGGIVYGGMYAMASYLRHLKQGFNASSQTTLNYLFYTGQVDAIVHPNDGSLVWNIGTKIDTENDDFYDFAGHYILTADDKFPAIIHQYDRHPRILKMIRDYYAD